MKQKVTIGTIAGMLIVAAVGISLILWDPGTRQLTRIDSISALPAFIFFVLTFAGLGAFMGYILTAFIFRD